MRKILLTILESKQVELSNKRFELVYQAGINNIISNLDYYHNKPYSCKSVLMTLFEEGVLKELQK
jgi:hypothetical protein